MTTETAPEAPETVAPALKPALIVDIVVADLHLGNDTVIVIRDLEVAYLAKIAAAGYDFSDPMQRPLCSARLSGNVFALVQASWSSHFQHWYNGNGAGTDTRSGALSCVSYSVGDFEPEESEAVAEAAAESAAAFDAETATDSVAATEPASA